MPIVEVQSWAGSGAGGRVVDSGSGGSYIARPGVGAEHLKPVRKPLVGAQQQPLVGLVTSGLPYVNGTVRARRQRIILLGSGALGNYRATDAVEVVQVKAAWAHPSMDEMPEDEVGAEDEVTGDLSLNTQVQMLRGPIRNIDRKESGIGSAGYLFNDLDRPQRGIAIREIACQADPDGRKNRHQIGAGEQGRRSGEVQRCADRYALNAWQRVGDSASQDRLPAEARPAEQRPLAFNVSLKEKVVKNACARVDHHFLGVRGRPR